MIVSGLHVMFSVALAMAFEPAADAATAPTPTVEPSPAPVSSQAAPAPGLAEAPSTGEPSSESVPVDEARPHEAPTPAEGSETEASPAALDDAEPPGEGPVEEGSTEPVALESDAPTDAPAPPARSFEFTPGVQVFVRSQTRINPDFDSAPDTATNPVAVLQRIRLQARAKWGPLSGFAQVQDVRNWGTGGSIGMHQGYVELAGARERKKALSGSIRVGRQEIALGRQRLIGPLLWLPGARAFDAVAAKGTVGRLDLHAFVSMMAPPQTFDRDPNDPDAGRIDSRGAQLSGLMLAARLHEAFSLEVLTLLDVADAVPTDIDRDRVIGDFGGRIWGKPFAGFHYDAEGHGQLGQVGSRHHQAWAGAGTVGYQRPHGRMRPGAELGYAIASGAACTNPTGSEEGCGAEGSSDFFNFYPTNHIHYGLVDLMNWSNTRDVEFAAKLAAGEWFQAKATYHLMQLHEPSGRWTNAGGALVGAGWDPDNESATLGQELDVTATARPWAPLMLQAGYGVFLPTQAGAALGGSSPQHFAYLWLVTTF